MDKIEECESVQTGVRILRREMGIVTIDEATVRAMTLVFAGLFMAKLIMEITGVKDEQD